jgi:hypothetical protein
MSQAVIQNRRKNRIHISKLNSAIESPFVRCKGEIAAGSLSKSINKSQMAFLEAEPLRDTDMVEVVLIFDVFEQCPD